MRAAPAVSVKGSGGWLWRLVNGVLPGLAAGALVLALLQHAERPAWPAAVVALATAAVAWWQARPRAVALNWDGQCWTADGKPGALQVMIDLGSALLLRVQPEAGAAARWVAVTAAEAGSAWHGLRVAVCARPPEPTARVRKPEQAAD